jgi:hypothetical protein
MIKNARKGYMLFENTVNFYLMRRKTETDDLEEREIIGNLEKELSDL